MDLVRHQRFAVLMLVLACTACGARGETSPPAVAESVRFGAALAFLTVENQTGQRLAIAFRPAAGAGGEVGIGIADPGETVRLAPVPAEEVIVLIARAPDARQLDLPARAFDIGERWNWVIPADAAFRAPR